MNEIKKRWDDRYSEKTYAYGILPNEFLKSRLDKIEPSNILFPAEGEGRNAVYAASLGWNVSAFDISSEGQKKANLLASQNNVTIDYRIDAFEEIGYKENQFDVIALIYAHFPPSIKSSYHKKLDNYLKPGGLIILEGFSKKNLVLREKNPKIGGPNDINFLFSIEEINADFPNYDIIELEEKEVELNEGLYHIGRGAVVRFVGRKK